MGGITDRITAETKTGLNEKVRDWKREYREMGWSIRGETEPEKNDDGLWEVEVSAHS